MFFAVNVSGADQIPDCLENGKPIAVDNERVLSFKDTTQTGFLARAHVYGPIKRVFDERSSHARFEIVLGPEADDMLEVVYNKGFGALPALRSGMNVETCGDFINSEKQNGPYPPSPSGAIIHWVHKSNNPKKHASGYVVIDGKLFGMGHARGHGRIHK